MGTDPRGRRFGGSLVLIVLLAGGYIATSATAQEATTRPATTRTWIPASFENKPIKPLLVDQGFHVFGGDDVKGRGAAHGSLPDLVLTLEQQYDALVTRPGNQLNIYFQDAAKDNADQFKYFDYIYQCRRSRAADLVTLLRDGKPLGFPQAAPLTGTGTGNFTRHASAMPSGQIGSLAGDTKFQLTLDNGILVTGTFDKVYQAVQKLRLLDRPTRVVLIEILIVEYFHEDQFAWRYNLTDGAALKGDPPSFSSGLSQPATISPPADTFGPQPWGIDFQNLAFNPATGATSLAYSGIGTLTSQFKQNLTALASEKLARIVTNPHIAVVNGQSGQILLNEKFNFVNAITVPTGTITQQADSINTITSINVTPTIVGEGRVHVAVNTTLATFDDVAPANSSTLPGQRVNELGTSVILDERDSLILGGLVKQETTEERSKIPGLAKIPVLGHLFRTRNDIRKYSETVVYIIPEVQKDELRSDQYYRDLVLEYADKQQPLVEEIRARHRYGKLESKRLYHYKEQIDHIEHHNLHQELHPRPKWLREDCNCGPNCVHEQQVLDRLPSIQVHDSP